MQVDCTGFPTIEPSDILIVQTECGDTSKDVEVYRDAAGTYHVLSGGVVRHPGCSPEDAMRALGWYLNSSLR